MNSTRGSVTSVMLLASGARVWAGGALLSLCLLGCASMGPGATSGAGATHPLLGAAAPPFELASPDGKQKLRLSDYAGKVVLIDFWATWCVPCRKSFPAYQHIADQFGSKLAVIGISVDNEAAGVAEFAKAHGGKFPVLWDDGQITSHSYQLDTMPATFIVDASGVVRFAHFQSGEEHAIESEIRSLLQ